MDISTTTIPDSTQVNADDLTKPLTVTIESVTQGTSEQPINIALVETPGRAYRPSKSMRRVLVACWGSEADAYVGRKMTLFREPTIKFGRDVVGGVRISHLSNIDKAITVPLTVSRGKRESYVVQPLPDAPTNSTSDITQASIASSTSQDELREWWKQASPSMRKLIEARVKELDTPTTPEPTLDGEGEKW